ncbi:DUF423 domain-containing protein [Paenibacillus kyungheensis]|uniref:DUF423 domain-containing protein n=1 Tax=Paenibacillus kyungheensis TaxID=1452732 RepID=A0AAX3M5S5_9BACL|nr:DUF423 domain-containing protein [Paenibacillus kyungheensis]WCT57278.1 DUF423 domain-containing protein [Paenibacillus kyungheensis]
MQRTYLIIGSILGMIGVGIGAFGAHLLEPIIGAQLMQTFKTGVEYHFVHTLAIIMVAILAGVIGESSLLRWAGRLFTVGVIIFSGSLYVLSITGIKVLGAITPIGGLCFIAGWFMLALVGAKYGKRA